MAYPPNATSTVHLYAFELSVTQPLGAGMSIPKVASKLTQAIGTGNVKREIVVWGGLRIRGKVRRRTKALGRGGILRGAGRLSFLAFGLGYRVGLLGDVVSPKLGRFGVELV